MARLKTSGTLTLREVANFFGVGGTVTLRQFLRGGGIVPNISENFGVPSSGTLTLRQLLGVYDAPLYTPISVSAGNVFDSNPGGVASGTSTANVSGGDGTHTYAWTRISGDAVLTTGANSATAGFAAPSGTNTSSVYRVTVNDGTTSDTDDINVTLNGSIA